MSEQAFWESVFLACVQREGVNWARYKADEALKLWRERWDNQGDSAAGPYRDYQASHPIENQ